MTEIKQRVAEYQKENGLSRKKLSKFRMIDIYLLECKKQGGTQWKDIQELLREGL